MADAKITDLGANTTPISTDVMVIVDDPGGTPVTQKITLANLATFFAALASPTFTGTPASTTPSVDTNSTRIATTAFVLAQAASQAEQETGSSTTKFVTSGRQQFHPSACKFWTFVTGAGSPTMSANYNTTSIADTGVGFMTVTIATDFSSANWSPAVCGISNARTVTAAAVQWVSAAMAAGTIELTNSDLSATPVVEDVAVGWSVIGFGDQ